MKKFLSIILSAIMVITMLPSIAISSFADEEPSFVGPNDSDHAYLDVHSNGEDYSFYFMGSIGDASIDGISYDLATNTLTLDSYNEPSTIIEASEMGSDFTISVAGENHIKAITVFADRYMGSLTITGEGSIAINENKDYDDVPLYLDANDTGSILEVDNSVQLSVCANDDDTSVKVLNSLNENPIICAYAEDRISEWEGSSSQNRFINAHDTQTNTFWAVKDSDSYTALCWDEFAGDTLYYEFVLVNKTIDGKDITFADPKMDDMGNPCIISSENVDTSDSIIACQIMNQYERQAVERADDETEYTLTEYTRNSEGPFWDVHKVIYDEDLGPFFYLVAEELTEKPTEYTPVRETINNNFTYIEGDFANFEKEGPSDSDISFSANVRDSAITYHNEETIYIEKGNTELISFNLLDNNDVPYVSAWYSMDMADAGFEIAPEPVVVDDVYYASITNNAEIGKSGTLIVNAFSGEKFASPDFDFITTEPDATFTLNIASVEKYAGIVSVNGAQYPEGSTITIHTNEAINMYYDVPSYPDYCINSINPDALTAAGFGFELAFDDSKDGMPYAIITAGDNLAAGTSAVVQLAIMRFDDCIINDFNLEITPSIYSYAVTIMVEENKPAPTPTNPTPAPQPSAPVEQIIPTPAPDVVTPAPEVVAPAPAPAVETVKLNGEVIAPNKDGEYISKKAKKPTITKATKGKKSFKITWKKVKSVSGYQVQYSTSSKFTKKTTKNATYKGNKSFTKTVKKLKGGKKYYVRIRTYKTVNGKKVYSNWSKTTTVTTKK